MTSKECAQLKLPDAPGVYLFKRGKKILYIGKATSLKSRVKSYFSKDIDQTRGPRIVAMCELANALEYQSTDSVLEALILEAALIKRHQPKYNSDEKDDKSWNYVVLTREAFPRVLTVRGKNLPFFEDPILFTAGPFPHGGELAEAMKIIRKIFPYRDTCAPLSGAQCFNAQIGLCPGVCSGTISKREYARTIRHLKLFFQGKKGQLVREIGKEMKTLAKEHKFEEAARVRNQLFALTHIRDVAMLKKSVDGADNRETRIEAYDISHISGTSGVGVMVVMEGGLLAKGEYRKFKLRVQKNDDVGTLKEVLMRRLRHREWRLPDLIVVDGALPQKNVAEELLKEHNHICPVVAVTKDARHKAAHLVGDTGVIRDHHEDILAINVEVHRFAIAYHRHLRDKVR